MNFALLTSGWTSEIELFISESDMNERIEGLKSSMTYVEGKYKLANSETNKEYLISEQYPDFVRTSFRLFRDYESANEFIKSKRKEEISHTFILFERM